MTDCVKLAQSQANIVSTLTHDSYILNDKHVVWELETLSLNLRFLAPTPHAFDGLTATQIQQLRGQDSFATAEQLTYWS